MTESDLQRQLRAFAQEAAPEVEPVGAEEAIERAAGSTGAVGRGSARRPVLAVAAVVLVLAGVVAVAALASSGEDHVVADAPDGPDPVTSPLPADTSVPVAPTDPPAPGEVAFRVLGMGERGEPMGTLRAAYDEGELSALWSDAGLPADPPAVDFEAQVVLSITIPDDACPPTLERFDVDGTTIEPVFVEPSGPCRTPLIPKTFVVAVDWASTGPSFHLFLPGDATYGFDDSVLAVSVRRSGSEPMRDLNDAEEAIGTAIASLGLEGCCGEPSHGGSGATTGVVWDGVDVGILGSPVQDVTFEHEGASRAFVPFNDLVLSSEETSVAGAHATSGDANGSRFLAFTCGAHLWTLGGPGMGAQATDAQLHDLAEALIPHLGCVVGEPPLATGHGDPHGR